MKPMERLIHLEIDYHRRVRLAGDERAAPRASWALAHDYAGLIAGLAGVSADDLGQVADRLAIGVDPHDLAEAVATVARWLPWPVR